jgi:dTDP-4-dehydrorhamnose reductase
MAQALVLGAVGMLGHKMFEVLSQRGHETTATVRGGDPSQAIAGHLAQFGSVIGSVDAVSTASVVAALDSESPDVVINCIGIVKQKPSASDTIASITVNSLFPHLLAEWCAGSGARLIHFSTDCVFSGSRGDYTADDESDATDLYGRTKYLGEVAGEGLLTLRTSIIGRELSSFRSLLEWFLANNGGTVNGYRRAIYSGLTTLQVAKTVADLLDHHPTLDGLYHLAGPRITKYDLLTKIKDTMGLDITIEPDDEFVIDRSLNDDRFVAATGIRAPSWDDMLAEMAADPTPYEDLR